MAFEKQRAGEQQADDNGVDDPAALRTEPLIFSELETSALQAAENEAGQVDQTEHPEEARQGRRKQDGWESEQIQSVMGVCTKQNGNVFSNDVR